MKRRTLITSALLSMLSFPFASMAETATISFNVKGQTMDPVKKEIGSPLEYLDYPDSYPFFSLDFAGWATNESGKPNFVNDKTIVTGDMTLYPVWISATKVGRRYYKRVTNRDDIKVYDDFYLVSADGKHAMKRNTGEYFNITFQENYYSITTEAIYFGKQQDVDIKKTEIDITEENNPFAGCLSYQFYPVSDDYGFYNQLMNESFSSTGNFAYQNEGGEAFFGMSENRNRDDIGYLGYNFQWDLSFTDDGYAKLENEKYGHIYYSETANADGRNFRLSKTETPNLYAYLYCEEVDTVYVRNLDYYVIRVQQPDADGMIMALVGSDFGGGNNTAMLENEGEYAVLKGGSVDFIYQCPEGLTSVKWNCSDAKAGKEGIVSFFGDSLEGFTVTPTLDTTIVSVEIVPNSETISAVFYNADGTSMGTTAFNIADGFIPDANGLLVTEDENGKNISGANVVYAEGGVYKCNKLVIDDAYGFYSPVDFIAELVIYNRTSDKDIVTVCLPFDVPAADINGTVRYLSAFDGSVLTFSKVAGNSISANTPYLVSDFDKAETLVKELYDVNVKKTAGAMETEVDGAIFFGLFNDSTFKKGDAGYDYYGFSSNKFYRFGTMHFPAYRAAIKLVSNTPVGGVGLKSGAVPSLDIKFDDGEVTSVSLVEAENGKVNVFDALGRAINLNVDEADALNGLKDGIYFVNGKKVIINNK